MLMCLLVIARTLLSHNKRWANPIHPLFLQGPSSQAKRKGEVKAGELDRIPAPGLA